MDDFEVQEVGFIKDEDVQILGKLQNPDPPVGLVNRIIALNVPDRYFAQLMSPENQCALRILFTSSSWRNGEGSCLIIDGWPPDEIRYYLLTSDNRLVKKWKFHFNLERRSRPIEIPN